VKNLKKTNKTATLKNKKKKN